MMLHQVDMPAFVYDKSRNYNQDIKRYVSIKMLSFLYFFIELFEIYIRV